MENFIEAILPRKKILLEAFFSISLWIGCILNAATPFTSDKHTVLLLHFDEGKGLPRDSSSCGNNPTVNKAEWLSAGKFGSCLYFDGKSGFLAIPDSKSLNISDGEITIEAWVKPEPSTANYPAIISKYSIKGGYFLTGSSSAALARFFLRADPQRAFALNSDKPLPVGEWSHIAGVRYKDGNVKLFVNGKEQAMKTTFASTFASPGVYLRIGNYYGDYFAGAIDEVRISTVARYGKISPEAVITGTVFHDKNRNAKKDQGEYGIAGVPVSDGKNIVLSDSKGIYRLNVSMDEDPATIFVIAPDGYKTSDIFHKL
ncbi:MAG: metallophosphoesterase N-terminal domain-containing protein, partial [Victivallaceae bacterium]|nr:metallophosphoesterase N-terminal domain-containing protein [Victivallaceae bacterium]